MSKHQKKSGPRYVALHYFLLTGPAWKHLSAIDRAVYLEVALRYNGSNNGKIGCSCRVAADGANVSYKSAARSLRRLEKRGFIVAEERGSFNYKYDPSGKRKRLATEWRLTIYDSDIATTYKDTLATKEFMRWQPSDTGSVLAPTPPPLRRSRNVA
jgi:hypothetical protein